MLLVSHDRSFLDNVVTQTIAYEGDATWRDYVGGYEDWLEQSAKNKPKEKAPAEPQKSKTEASENKATEEQKPRTPRSNRISPWEQKELDELPEKIAELETKQEALSEQLSDPDTYTDGSDKAQEIQDELEKLSKELEKLFERWEFLESKDPQ